jgi:hypothetical protein
MASGVLAGVDAAMLEIFIGKVLAECRDCDERETNAL